MVRYALAHMPGRPIADQSSCRTAPRLAQPARDQSLAQMVPQGRIDPSALSRRDLLGLQRSLGNRAIGRLLAGASAPASTAMEARPEKGPPMPPSDAVTQRARLPVGGTVVETDYLSTDTLEQGMIYGVRGTAKATGEEQKALRQEISKRRSEGKLQPPGPTLKPVAPRKEDFDATMRRHRLGRDRLLHMVEEGLKSQDGLLRNSCEWVKSEGRGCTRRPIWKTPRIVWSQRWIMTFMGSTRN